MIIELMKAPKIIVSFLDAFLAYSPSREGPFSSIAKLTLFIKIDIAAIPIETAVNSAAAPSVDGILFLSLNTLFIYSDIDHRTGT